MQWVSKSPGKVPPIYNIVMIFDVSTWMMIIFSMMTVSATLLMASRFGLQYGVGTKDTIIILMTPFGTLNAGSLPSWFDIKVRRSKPVFSPGFAGNFILLLWTVMGTFLAMAFLCNIRAMLMKPAYERAIDSTQDIFELGKVAYILYPLKLFICKSFL